MLERRSILLNLAVLPAIAGISGIKAGTTDPRLLELWAKLMPIQERIEHLRPAYNAEVSTAIDDEYEALDADFYELSKLIYVEPAQTLDGLIIKIRALGFIYPEGITPDHLGLDGETADQRLAHSILSDLISMGART